MALSDIMLKAPPSEVKRSHKQAIQSKHEKTLEFVAREWQKSIPPKYLKQIRD